MRINKFKSAKKQIENMKTDETTLANEIKSYI